MSTNNDGDIIFADKLDDLKILKTGTFLDELSGVWGLPFERIIEFYGSEKTGKSTASFHVIAAAQQQGYRCLLADVEHSFVKEYAQDLGIDLSKLGIIKKAYAEEYIDAVLDAVKSEKWDVIVFDSIGSLSSRIEAEKEAGEKTIGTQANLMSAFVRKLAPQISFRKQMFIGINHTRVIDLMTGKTGTMGGKAWSEKKKLSIEFRERSGVLLKSGENIVGKGINVRVMKNAVGPTERKEMDLQLIFGKGFRASANLAQEAIDKGVIGKQGNSYFFLGETEKIAVGRAKLDDWVEANAEKVKAALQ